MLNSVSKIKTKRCIVFFFHFHKNTHNCAIFLFMTVIESFILGTQNTYELWKTEQISGNDSDYLVAKTLGFLSGQHTALYKTWRSLITFTK